MKGIYKLTNTVNNKIYIGKSICIENRLYHHLWYLKNNRHNNKHLQRAYNKYGEKAFKFEILKELSDKNNINQWEKYYIAHLESYKINKGYNILEGGNGGAVINEETRKILSEQSKGNKNCLGRHHSEETKQKIRLGNLGKIKHKGPLNLSDEQRRIRSINAKKQYELNPERRYTLYKINQKWLSSHSKEEIYNRYSHKLTDEQKRALSERMIELGIRKGKNNSQYGKRGCLNWSFGKIYVCKDDVGKYIDKENLEKYLNDGWITGCKKSRRDKIGQSNTKFIYNYDGIDFMGWCACKDYIVKKFNKPFSQTGLNKLCEGKHVKGWDELYMKITKRLKDENKIN